MPNPTEQDPRTYLAAERTFLAWIRTGLGLMGVGFAVSRFGLFLREFTATQHLATSLTTGLTTAHSVVTGVALVLLGVIINIVAVVDHLALTRQLANGTWQPGKPSKAAVSLALLLAAIGIGMAVYLLRFR